MARARGHAFRGVRVMLPAGKRRSFGTRKYNILPQAPCNLLTAKKITGNWQLKTGSSRLEARSCQINSVPPLDRGPPRQRRRRLPRLRVHSGLPRRNGSAFGAGVIGMADPMPYRVVDSVGGCGAGRQCASQLTPRRDRSVNEAPGTIYLGDITHTFVVRVSRRNRSFQRPSTPLTSSPNPESGPGTG